MSELRERKTNGTVGGATPSKPAKAPEKPDTGITVLDILRIIVGLLLVSSIASYFVTSDSFTWGWKPWFANPAAVIQAFRGPLILTDMQLREYDGSDPKKPIYLAINGTIYDVSAGRKLYGKDGSYNIFAGKDAARAYVTGCFFEDANPDLRGAEWTYIPTDIPNPDDPQPGDKEKETPAMKTRREQELRKARKKVRETLEGWAKTFAGDGGKKKYFEVGKVKRDPKWNKKLPKKKLCAQAQKMRPKPGDEGTDAGAIHRQSKEEGGRGYE